MNKINYLIKEAFFLIEVIREFLKLYYKGKINKNKKALIINCNQPYLYTRYFYLLVKFFSLSDFDVYLINFNFKKFRIGFKTQYFNLIFKEGIITLSSPTKSYDYILELNDENLSYDYFSENNKNTYHIPMTMHPKFYYDNIWNNKINIQKVRCKSVFMAGNFDPKSYSQIDNTPFKIESRINTFNFLKFKGKLHEVTSKFELNNLITVKKSNACILISEFRIEMNELRNILSEFNFFLALPGVIMPYAHNLIEAISVGTIPIIHKNYAKLMTPKLVNNLNAIIYNDLEDLILKLDAAYELNDERVIEMQSKVLDYYQKFLTPKSVTQEMADSNYDMFYLQAEKKSLEILKNKRIKI